MTAEPCPREDELLEALESAFVAPELASHVASCPSCRELHLLAGALLDDRAQTMLEAPVPSAGTMWLRMRVRRRHDAEATARRSLLIGQAATLFVALVLVLSFFGTAVALDVRELVATMSTPLLAALATSLLAAPIAGWVAIRQK
jgi:predicted anti-sigma-YlaC factor YlaD